MAGKLEATEEQKAYAQILDVGMKVGLLALVITFGIYLTGIFSPHIPLDQVSQYWGMPVKDYLKAADIDTGWSWLSLLGQGDFLNFAGIAFLAGLTVICYLRILPISLKKKDGIYTALAVTEVLVLVLAASGVLSAGAH